MLHDSSQNRHMLSHFVPAHQPRRQIIKSQKLSHILIPTALLPSEHPAVSLGLQIASTVGAMATFLHIVPRPSVNEPSNPWNWLDALDNLHQSLNPVVSTQARLAHLEETRGRVTDYLERELQGYLQSETEIEVECREGDVTEEILRFAATESVDLVILSSSLHYWGLPFVPPRIQRLLQQMNKRVIVVRRSKLDETIRSHNSPGRAEHGQ